MGYLINVAGSAKPSGNSSGAPGRNRSEGASISLKFRFYVDENSGKVSMGNKFFANKPFQTYHFMHTIHQNNVTTTTFEKFIIKPAGTYKFIKSEIINGKKYHYIEA
ncbi:MAG: hypothetical protein PHX21_12845 [bacterium]|nr:hypothetical protein [bacterium]